jgi:Spy/CpxP family protein refolding chaperone
MRNLALVLGMLMMVATFSVPPYAMGGGMGGGGMMSGGGYGMMGQGSGNYGNRPDQRGQQMQELNQRFYEQSANVKAQIQTREQEMDALLNSSNPDMGKVKTLHTEITALRAKLAEEQRDYDLEAARINSGYGSGNGNGWGSYGSGMGYDGQTGDYGSGR